MNRNATPRLSVPRPDWFGTPAATSSSGAASATMIDPRYSDPIPRLITHETKNATPTARKTSEPAVSSPGKTSLRSSSAPRTTRKMPNHGSRARPLGPPGPPASDHSHE